MKKQGFTLIELMVVIVIMGILAAVAVPKLFGMIAKSKASELGPAAGEYVKLQNAFITETSKIGNFQMVGYEMKSTTTFTYAEGAVSFANGTADIPSSANVTWKATANIALNDCAQSSVWQIFVKKSTGTGAEYDGSIGNGSAQATAGTMDLKCLALTSSFKTLANDN